MLVLGVWLVVAIEKLVVSVRGMVGSNDREILSVRGTIGSSSKVVVGVRVRVRVRVPVSDHFDASCDHL